MKGFLADLANTIFNLIQYLNRVKSDNKSETISEVKILPNVSEPVLVKTSPAPMPVNDAPALSLLKGLNMPSKPTGVFIMPHTEKLKTFGVFKYKADPNSKTGDIIITDNWEDENIVRIIIPQLKKINGSGLVACHRLIAPQMIGLFNAFEERDLTKHILSWDGCFNPRFQRGSTSKLSNHAWGTAFDINAEWNGLNSIPADIGQKGCIKELVATALEFGFYWGGHFSRLDGMHFEVFRILKNG